MLARDGIINELFMLSQYLRKRLGFKMNVEQNYQTTHTESISTEKLKDISSLLNKKDAISELIAIGITESVLEGYSLVNKGVALMFAKAFKKVYDTYGEKSSDVIMESMFQNIGGKVYAIGVNSFLTRLNEKVGEID